MKVSPVRILLGVLVAVLFLGLFLSLLSSMGALFGSIFLGWFSFLQRVWPQVTINWNGVGMVVLCSVLILAGLHSLCAWLFAAVAAKVHAGGDTRWQWSWTFALYTGVWLLFGAIMGAVGWLIRSDEPMLKPRRHSTMWVIQLKHVAMNLAVCAIDADWNLEKARREFFKGEATLRERQPNVFEDFHVVFLEGTNRQLAAGVVFHCDPETRGKAGFMLVSPEMPGELQPIEMLPSVLVRYQSRTNSPTISAGK